MRYGNSNAGSQSQKGLGKGRVDSMAAQNVRRENSWPRTNTRLLFFCCQIN